MGKESWLVRLTIIGSIAFMLWMGVMLDRAIAGLRAAKAQTGWSTPTHFKGRNYADGLVTEYRTKLNATYDDCYTTTGSVTIVVAGVEYQVDVNARPFSVPVQPGYYQVNTGLINDGIITILLPGETEQDAENPMSRSDAFAEQYGACIVWKDYRGGQPTSLSGNITSERFAK